MKNRSNKILLIAGAILLLVALREQGYVTLDYFDSKFDHETKLETYTQFYKGEQLTGEKSTNNNSLHSDSSDSSWGLHTNGSKTTWADLSELLKDDIATDDRIHFVSIKFQPVGRFWTPFFKVGSCKYSIDFKATGDNSREYTGSITGESTFQINGLSTAAAAKSKVSRTITKAILDEIKKGIKLAS